MEIIWYVSELVVNENYWELWRYDWLVGEWIISMVQSIAQLVKEYTGFMESLQFIMIITDTCSLTLFWAI
jgi:hypothetical protein